MGDNALSPRPLLFLALPSLAAETLVAPLTAVAGRHSVLVVRIDLQISCSKHKLRTWSKPSTRQAAAEVSVRCVARCGKGCRRPLPGRCHGGREHGPAACVRSQRPLFFFCFSLSLDHSTSYLQHVSFAALAATKAGIREACNEEKRTVIDLASLPWTFARTRPGRVVIVTSSPVSVARRRLASLLLLCFVVTILGGRSLVAVRAVGGGGHGSGVGFRVTHEAHCPPIGSLPTLRNAARRCRSSSALPARRGLGSALFSLAALLPVPPSFLSQPSRPVSWSFVTSRSVSLSVAARRGRAQSSLPRSARSRQHDRGAEADARARRRKR